MSNPISRFPDSDPDKLAASVFAAGLMHSFVRREEIVRWADRRIEEMPQPPEWIIDLSLSQNTPVMDLIAHLRRVGDEIDRVSTCEAIYALLPDVTLYSFDQANAFAKKLYRIAYECVGADWKCELLRKADRLADDFEFLRDGYLAAKQSDVVRAVQKFIEEHRDEQIVRHLQPVQWSWQPDSSRATKANVHLIHVGLDSWIIQDGNYADFAVGDVAKFALEFNPLRENNADGSRTPSAEHLKGSR